MQVRAPFGPLNGHGDHTLSPQLVGDTHEDLGTEDLRRLLEIERGQRLLLENAYEATVVALARALESKDRGTRAHSQRVQRYALELAAAVAPDLPGDASAEYGFLLHEVGKIGIPDSVLRKRGPLDADERRLMETHTLMGERMLADVALLREKGSRSSARTTNAGTAGAIRTGCWATRSRSVRGSSPSPTHSMP
jgi:hypothetical protein